MRSLLRALTRSADPLPDADLLARYAADRDPAAFELLVWRHGGMVLGVCRRHLPATDADDAFQATFLILSRKAGRVRAATLPGWLHRVARRVAVRAAARGRRRREVALSVEPPTRPASDTDLSAALDAEIDRLPERLRQVVVLCYLDGRSTADAAGRLGVPRGTVLSRLHAARQLLRDRLTRRGLAPPVVGLAAVVSAEQVAACGCGGGTGAVILANEVLAMSLRKTVLGVAVGLVLAGGAGVGVGVLNAQSGRDGGLPVVVPRPMNERPPDPVVPAEQQPTKPAKPSGPSKDILLKLDQEIHFTEANVRDSLSIENRIESAKIAIQSCDAELVRLLAKKASLDAQLEAGQRPSVQQPVTTEKQLADAIAADPEHAARSRLLAELWQAKVQAEATGKSDDGLDRRVVNAQDSLATVRSRIEKAIGERAQLANRSAFESHISDCQLTLQVTKREIDILRTKRKSEEEEILKCQQTLFHISPDRVSDMRDKLRLLRSLKLAIEFNVSPVPVQDNHADKLDSILAELRELRRLVEAKK